MKTKNNLPKYWVVQCNTLNPNWIKVIDYLKNVHNEKWAGDRNGNYYGYDGNIFWKGTNVYNTISKFINTPVVLTIEEFVEMTEGFVLPEKWCIKRNKENDKIVTDFINNYSESTHCYLDYNQKNPYLHYTKGVSSNDKPWDNYTEITFEQFKKYVLKTEETMKTITHTQAQQIIDIACATWKERLFTKWGRKIVFKETIQISDNDYQEMRNACTSEQHQLFDEIFGSDKPTFKIGDWVYWSGNKPIIAQIVREATYDRDCWVLNEKTHNSCHQDLLRPATKAEIQKAKYIPEGTPCLVRDSIHSNWELVYSLGDGTYKGELSNRERKQVQVLDINNLPKF